MDQIRAGIVVTGTEVLTARIVDKNGPWLSERLRELGFDVVHITICRDRPEDIQAQLEHLFPLDLLAWLPRAATSTTSSNRGARAQF